MRTDFYTKRGRLTRYSLACGYVERATDLHLEQIAGTNLLRVVHKGRELYNGYHLDIARRIFDHVKKEPSMTFLEEIAVALRPIIQRAGYLVTLDAMSHIAQEQAVKMHAEGLLADERYLKTIAACTKEAADYLIEADHVA